MFTLLSAILLSDINMTKPDHCTRTGVYRLICKADIQLVI